MLQRLVLVKEKQKMQINRFWIKPTGQKNATTNDTNLENIQRNF
jgi:hypothetical protein